MAQIERSGSTNCGAWIGPDRIFITFIQRQASWTDAGRDLVVVLLEILVCIVSDHLRGIIGAVNMT
jgi:hypothetical protein